MELAELLQQEKNLDTKEVSKFFFCGVIRHFSIYVEWQCKSQNARKRKE